jgi:exopolyphosphatase
VPLVQTPRPDLSLRAENSHALSAIGFDYQKLVCMDDLYRYCPASSTSFPSKTFALVDHNRLGGYFLHEHPDANVVAIVDHHQDEGLYKDTANPRIITVPAGSCSSLIARLLEKECKDKIPIPPELATLLLCGILIDTHGLKSKSKTEKVDILAAIYLLPRSIWASSLPSSFLAERPESPFREANPDSSLLDVPELTEMSKTLDLKKESVSHLGTRDLLRRDYKEHSLTPSWDKSKPILIGLASVPTSIKSCIDQDADRFWSSVEKWMTERNLAALSILTSFREEKSMFSSKRGKHLREMLILVGDDAVQGELKTRVFAGLEASEELDLKSFKRFGAKVEEGFKPSVKARMYKQGNLDATRKVIAPLLAGIIEGTKSTAEA